MRKTNSALFLILLCSAVLLSSEFAAGTVHFYSEKETVRDILSDRTEDACTLVKDALGQGLSAKDVVRTALSLGHNSCLVIKCALYGGGNLEDVINGAYDAGMSSDVIAKCCVDAGANPREVAGKLPMTGHLGLYSTEPGPGPVDPMPPAPPRPVSPYRFR